ncbi:MAG: phosphopentomutase [Bryobacteraceae bacterium]
MPFRRVTLLILDSVGIGAMPDAAEYGDSGSDTLGNIARQRRLKLPNLCRLGLANIRRLEHLEPAAHPAAAYGRCALASPGKDTTTGHWEIAGIHLEKPFPLFQDGFPPEIMNKFEQRIGRSTLGNCAASGTEIIKRLGEEHLRTGSPIVYTSADSVFQVAAHEEVIPTEALYRICETAREILRGPFEVGRVIARSFRGTPGNFMRTPNRKDYSVPPPEGMLLDRLEEQGVIVHAVGKISDVFLGRGIRKSDKTKNNTDGMEKTIRALEATPDGLVFINLVDFDQQYGHRNDVEGYARALEETDAWLPGLEAALGADDLLLISADHGCDPTTAGTDHSREYVPLLAWRRGGAGANLGTRATLSDVGQTIARNFGTSIARGESFLEQLCEKH